MVDDSTEFSPGVEALKATAISPAQEQAAQIEALRAELEMLRESVSSVAATARDMAGTSANAMVADAEEYLKRNVFASLGIAAVVGYLWGRTR